MIYNQLTDSFITSNIFENVVLKDKKIEHEYSLKTEVIKLYQTFEEDKSYAVLKLKFDLVKDNKVLKSFNFDKKVLTLTLRHRVVSVSGGENNEKIRDFDIHRPHHDIVRLRAFELGRRILLLQ